MTQIQPDVPVSNNGHSKPDTNSFSFAYNGRSISPFQDDCIRFLNRLDPGSVDVLVTDPAYAGMNNKLKLGHGRIVGKYADKGAINGKWFTEFDDTVDNYIAFLTACKRVLNPITGHLYIMFDSFSLLSLGHLVRTLF